MSYSVVVLAEDDPVLRRGLSDFLADEGFLVREAHDVAGVRHAMKDREPTALVLDVHLGNETIASVISEVTRDPDHPQIVLISASREGVALAEKHGVQLLAKPFELQHLVQALLVPAEDRAGDA